MKLDSAVASLNYLKKLVMPFSVNCPLCQKKFKTGTSLTKHTDLRHPERTFGIARFQDDDGKPCDEPKAAPLGEEKEVEYLKWLSVVVERINASLVPDHPGNHLM